MRAYQLKIADRNSERPLWWRCIVPGGITFSALSIILDVLTGYPDGDDFSFIFFHKAKIWEPEEEKPLKADFQNEAADAASTCIGVYLEDEKTFSYKRGALYLKLTVELRRDDYVLPYPLVTKCSDEAQQPVLRALLGDRLCILPGEQSRQTRRSILDAADGTLIRMTCAENPLQGINAIEHSGREIMRDLAALMHGSSAERFSVLRKYDKRVLSYHALLNDYPVRDLRGIARSLALPEQHSKDKELLVGALIPALLEPSNFERALCLLSDDDMDAFKDALDCDGPYEIPSRQENAFDRMSWMGYAFVTPGKTATVTIPDELRKLSASILTDALDEKRRRVRWVMACLNEIVPPYYAIIPLRKFCRLCRRTSDPELRSEEVPKLLDLIPEHYRDCVVTDTEVYAKELDKEEGLYQYVVNVHGDKPYYIMRQGEISELLEYGYPINEPTYRSAKRFLMNQAGVPSAKADSFMAHFCIYAAYGYNLSATSKLLTDLGIGLRKNQMIKFLSLIQDMANHTPTFYNCGYTPEAMHRAAPL